MAGQFGFASSASTSMMVINTPSPDRALTNLAYCSPYLLQKFAVKGYKNLFLALIVDSFVFSIAGHKGISGCRIALNSTQRRCVKISTNETISVSRFIPPDDFNHAVLTLELDFAKRGRRSEQIDAVLLSKELRKTFPNQVVTAGQKVLFEFHGNNYKFTVSQAVVEDQEKSLTGG